MARNQMKFLLIYFRKTYPDNKESDGHGKCGELDIAQPHGHLAALEDFLEVNAGKSGQEAGHDDGDESQEGILLVFLS